MTITLTPAEACLHMIQFAADAGLPVPQHLMVTVPGDDETALAAMNHYAAVLSQYGISYTTDDTDLRRALVINCGAGVTFRLIHALHQPEGVPA